MHDTVAKPCAVNLQTEISTFHAGFKRLLFGLHSAVISKPVKAQMRAQTFRIPRAQNKSSVVRICFYCFYHISELINTLTSVVYVHVFVFCSEVSPLEPVNWSQITCMAKKRS